MINLCEVLGQKKDKLIQNCLPIEKAKKLTFPLWASEKLDGVFCMAHYNYPLFHTEEKVTIFSRTGEVYTSMGHLKDSLNRLMEDTGSDFIIFEAYTKGVKQATISGWCRDTKENHKELQGYVHDCLSLSEMKGDLKTPYKERYEFLRSAFDRLYFPNLHHVESLVVNNLAYLNKLAQSVWDRGGEGLVGRNPDAPYQIGKRNADMIKVKQGVSFDLKVIGLEEGKGKYTNMLGKLICRWKDNDTIRVGSGLTDQQRKEWWNDFNYDDIVGKIVQIDAMCESSKGKLREPRFKGIRYDKLKGDY